MIAVPQEWKEERDVQEDSDMVGEEEDMEDMEDVQEAKAITVADMTSTKVRTGDRNTVRSTHPAEEEASEDLASDMATEDPDTMRNTTMESTDLREDTTLEVNAEDGGEKGDPIDEEEKVVESTEANVAPASVDVLVETAVEID